MKVALSVAVVVGILWIGFEVFQPEKSMEKGNNRLRMSDLQKALWALEANLPSSSEGGYVTHAPSSAAAQMVGALNAAQELSPQEKEELRRQGVRFFPKPVPYRLQKPDGPWQVVLVPDDEKKAIRVEAFGQDLCAPVTTFEMACCP